MPKKRGVFEYKSRCKKICENREGFGKNNRLIISTHSDTLAGKINNLILVSRMKDVIRKNDILEKLDWGARYVIR